MFSVRMYKICTLSTKVLQKMGIEQEEENWVKIFYYFEGMWKMLKSNINEEQKGVTKYSWQYKNYKEKLTFHNI